jgi:iron uptake system component EfeO
MLRPLTLCLAVIAFSAPAFGAPQPALKTGIASYQKIVAGQIHAAHIGAEDLVKKLTADDLPGAKQAWIKARQGWERSETVTGGFFEELDKAIDAWPSASSGFHAIEGPLFGGAAAKDLLPLAKGLAGNLAKVDGQVAKTAFTAQGLYDGMTQLAYEVGESKSKGQESKASGTSLNDLKNNVQGIAALYDTVFATGFKKAKPDVDSKIRQQIAAVRKQTEVSDIAKLDQEALEKAAEMLATIFVDNAPVVGLAAPKLESDG